MSASIQEMYLRKFDWLVLKPVWFALLIGAVVFLWEQAWLTAAAMIVGMLLVGAVAASMHRERSTNELFAGYPDQSSMIGPVRSPLDRATSLRMSKALLSVAWVISGAALVIALHQGMRWYWAVGLAVLAGCLVPVVLSLALAATARPKSTVEQDLAP